MPHQALTLRQKLRFKKTLQEVIKGRTTIIITHRISQLVVNADRIIYMSDGRIVEEGAHEELMKLKGRYYATFKKQLLERLNSLPA